MALIKCPDCGFDVSSNAAACPKCAAPIAVPVTTNESGHDILEKDNNTSTRAALAQNEMNKSGFGMLVGQFFLIAAGLGIYNESWYWFIGVFLGGAVLAGIPFIGRLVALCLAASWGLLAAAIAAAASENDQTTMWVTGGIVFFIAMAVNFTAIDHVKDLQRK